jgi:hypothetical protein
MLLVSVMPVHSPKGPAALFYMSHGTKCVLLVSAMPVQVAFAMDCNANLCRPPSCLQRHAVPCDWAPAGGTGSGLWRVWCLGFWGAGVQG